MIHNRSVPAMTMLAHVTCADLPAAVAWLETGLGFEGHYRYGDPVAGVQMHLGTPGSCSTCPGRSARPRPSSER